MADEEQIKAPEGEAPEQEPEQTDIPPQGPLDGLVVSTDEETGAVQTEARFAMGVQEGETRTYDDEGRLETVSLFAAGALHGLSTAYDDEGNVAQQAHYRDGELNGELVAYEEGFQAMRATYVNGVQEGPATYYGNQGKVVTGEEFFVGGKRHGECRYYGVDGVMVSKTTFAAGKREGLAVLYYPSGEIFEISTWKNDLQHGDLERYYESGAVMEQSVFAEGELVEKREFNEDGSERDKEKAGKKKGIEKIFFWV